MKESVSQQAPQVIKKLQFSLLNPQHTVKYAEFEVTRFDLYTHNEQLPVKDGVLDRRLGTTEKSAFCETCGQATINCVDHYAYIKLGVPVFHIGYFKHTIGILQCICKTCTRVLLEEPDRRKPNLENMQRQALTKAVNTMSIKTVYCPYCSATNGAVKKAGALKIIHDKFRAKKTAEEMKKWKKSFAPALEEQKDLALYLNKAVHEDLNPLKVLDLFKRISDEDCELLGMQPKFVCIRPSVAQDGGSNEDDLTVKLTEIDFTNAVIKQGLARGVPTPQFMEQWDLLQLSVAMYINPELPGVPSQMGLKPIRDRFRDNLSGKRVDFSRRTVISPDPNLRIDEVAVPQRVAQILTYPERITSHNIEALQQAARNGPEIHPGANFVSRGQNKKFFNFGNRIVIADGLAIGDIVERHIIDGDVALFNRQPSLHKVRITFRLNECVCSPYNADFDDDEMNLHIPQTEEAQTEALKLMSIKHNLVTPRNGEPVIAAIQDFITASHLLSRKDQFFDRRQIDISPRTILKPVHLWTGKQIFSVLMRPNRKSKIMVNIESKCHRWEEAKPKNYPNRMKLAKDMSLNDGWLVIVNSEVMCGVMDKAIVGSRKKKSIFGAIMRDYGPHEAAAAMNPNYGFYLGINDVITGPELSTKKDGLVEEAYAHCQRLITKAKNGELETKPGCDQVQTLEAESMFSKVREAVGQICMKELSRQNAPLIMATCGSKGSVLDVSQMVACVGQQIIAGHHVPNGFQNRSLPHFPKQSKEPPSKGFVRNSFYSGLVATEFLFHAISGREGLVDTAVKTADTDYMQRRLMKALEDLTTQYDLSVRNLTGGVVQSRYGNDDLDHACLERDAQLLDLDRAWQYATATSRVGAPLLPFQIIDLVDTELGTKRFTIESRSDQGMYDTLERSSEWDEDTYLSFGASDAAKAAVNIKVKVTTRQVKTFLDLCWVKYVKLASNQTFHFAGVASMNITLSVPRIKEIINAAKAISTPIINCKLVTTDSEASARVVRGRLEKTLLGDVRVDSI
ncbi:MAG: hypothetical protein NXY57DRAFT_1066569 [Lentinula lateritia]|nr:MAG: hypothetical protein NXY57DRAFT_1066569 [Lentinula lateritia]